MFKSLDKLRSEINSLRNDLNNINNKKESWFQKKEEMSREIRKNIVVLDTEEEASRIKGIGIVVQIALESLLTRGGRVNVLERSGMKQILEEKKLQITGKS